MVLSIISGQCFISYRESIMVKTNLSRQQETKPSGATSNDRRNPQSSGQVPTNVHEVTPDNILWMQRTLGNQATQQILQRYSSPLIQREGGSGEPEGGGGELENEVEVDDSQVEGTIVFEEDEVPPIIIENPWTSADLQADPDLMTKHQGMKTLVKGGKQFATKSEPLKYTYSFPDDTIVEKGDEGTLGIHTLKSKSKLKDISSGMPTKWKKPFFKVDKKYEFVTGVTPITLKKGMFSSKINLYQFKSGANDYLTETKNITERTKKYVVLKIGGTEYHANPEDLYEGEATHKKTDDPLFPDGKALPEHIQQTGLGDCYLQAFLVNTAVQNPDHLKNMMFDNGDGSVTVRYYYKSGTNWEADFVRVEKSIATGVSGDKLYNDGALWAHIIEKSFAVFAGKHGMYGDALAPPVAKGYGAIEGGWTYQLGGVFYGKASKEATLEDMAFDTDTAKMLKANYAQIKKLFELTSSETNTYLDDDKEAVMLTASASWRSTLTRMITVSKELEGTVDLTSDYGKAVKDMREKLEAADTASKDPTNNGKDKMDIQEVADAVKKSSEYGVVAGAIGKEAIANPTDSLLNRFFELLNNFKELGSDSSQGQRYIYNHHAYSVVDFVPKDTTGSEYWPSKSDLDTKKNDVLQKLDPAKAEVILRNPHRTNTPTSNATELEPGKFSMTLEQFLVSFTRIEYGKVEIS